MTKMNLVQVVLITAVCLCRFVEMRSCELKNLSRNMENTNLAEGEDFKYYSRSHWEARKPLETTPLSTPVPYVVIHHSYTPPACNSTEDCFNAMRSMQDFHMDDRGWWDIGYNFGVGSDGVVYEGRGWQKLGAHALHFNTISIGICLIGDWSNKLPPNRQMNTAKSLIRRGVELGFIRQDYKLVGHRQVRDTACPGQALFNEIKGWPHYSAFPSSVAELDQVEELPEKVKELLSNKINAI